MSTATLTREQAETLTDLAMTQKNQLADEINSSTQSKLHQLAVVLANATEAHQRLTGEQATEQALNIVRCVYDACVQLETDSDPRAARAQMCLVALALLDWAQERMEAGRAGEDQLTLADRVFRIGWSPVDGLVIDDMSNPENHVPPDLFGVDRAAILAGLAAAIKARQAAGGDTVESCAVYEALQPYGPGRPLPLGLTDRLFRFFAVSAAVGAWDALREFEGDFEPRRGKALRKYFTSAEDVSMETLGEELGVSQERASQLLGHSLRFLWKRLPDQPTPEFPIDKRVAFPLQDLLDASTAKHTRRMRQRAADPSVRQTQQDSMRQAREQSWATWPTAREDLAEGDEEAAIDAPSATSNGRRGDRPV